VRAALVFSALTFSRPGTIRYAEWSEIDEAGRRWIIPAAKMKLKKELKLTKEPHIVPLATQAMDLLSKIRHFTGRSQYIFPNISSNKLPMSDGAVNMALRRMGYTGDQMTAHGFRSMASTLLNEADPGNFDIVEAQLAHTDKDKIRGIYNRVQYMEKRRKLMQDWANMLDSLRADAVAKADQHTP
jgi:integrase